MPAIKYIAQRSIIRVAFEVIGAADVSTDLSTSSPPVSTFNSTTTDLSGINANEWINVSGFNNGANNNWHQLEIDSTPNRITLNANTQLVTEAAPASATVTGYLHAKDNEYPLDLTFTTDNRERSIVKINSESLGGQIETITHRRLEFFSVNSGVVEPVDYPYMIEFLDSCESNEIFTFDRVGSIAVPVSPVAAVLEGIGYIEERVGIEDRRFSFRVRLI